MHDIYDTGTPKYQTTTCIYDALCELVKTEEMGLLSEMFTDVSWEGQDYYYTDAGYKLKERFEDASGYGDKMWLLDLAVWQIDQGEIHDVVFDALCNPDLAKRIGFKGLFIEKILRGDKSKYPEIIEKFEDEMRELNRFGYHETVGALCRAMGDEQPQIIMTSYSAFCHAICDKVRNLRLQKETQIITECRALLTSYDDFMFGLRANHHLFEQQERQFNGKLAALQKAYSAQVAHLLSQAKEQGVTLDLDGCDKFEPPVHDNLLGPAGVIFGNLPNS